MIRFLNSLFIADSLANYFQSVIKKAQLIIDRLQISYNIHMRARAHARTHAYKSLLTLLNFLCFANRCSNNPSYGIIIHVCLIPGITLSDCIRNVAFHCIPKVSLLTLIK